MGEYGVHGDGRGAEAAGQPARDIVVGVSGASGMALAECALRLLARMAGVRVHCIVSQGARAVLRAECGAGPERLTAHAAEVYAPEDLGAGPASGSWWRRGPVPAAMLVAPCSMGTLGALASGATRNLLQRAADVALKERLPLVLVTRESPLSAVHLRNMLALQEAGAVIMPFSPGFYLRPQSLDELLRQACGRIFDQLGLPHQLGRWGDAPTAG
ncbi:UbiX family flavin prenyltransferase [Desulfovibrio legallii]|uniref:Flavin prenyltransferase UbiX n=1 Tax=Desulfovibrio legallii TaxID=571438 RepID=A0A1G7P7N3_9BACT|nr:UbiX family flavin prenyltransferase [Desulfovibrio legallii]SDF81619.1 4-hydroxy-3-polyprenylbenzoate decarboxylase [Desulfovibrio legallii]